MDLPKTLLTKGSVKCSYYMWFSSAAQISQIFGSVLISYFRIVHNFTMSQIWVLEIGIFVKWHVIFDGLFNAKANLMEE